MGDILYKRLSDETIGACLEVHKLMGSNLSEKIYEACVQKELVNQRLSCRQTEMDRYLL